MTEQQIKDLAAKTGIAEDVLSSFDKGEKTVAEVFSAVEVFKTEDLTARIKNEIEKAKPEIEKNAVGNTYGAIDKRIEQISGIKANEGEKTADYINRVITEKTGLKGNVEIERLQREIAAKDGLLAEKETAFSKLQTDFAEKEKQRTIESTLDQAIFSLNIDADSENLDKQRKLLKLALKDQYDIQVEEGGKMKFIDRVTGKEMRDDKKAELMDPRSLVASFAPGYVKLKEQSNSSPGPGYKQPPIDPKNVQFSQFKTVAEFVEHAQKSGIATHGPEWNKLENEAAEYFGKQLYAEKK